MVLRGKGRGVVAFAAAALLLTALPAEAPAQGTGARGGVSAESLRGGNRPDHTIVLEGTGAGGTRYRIAGGGELRQVEGRIQGFNATIQNDDVVRGTVAEGGLRGGVDAFLVYGPLPDIELENPRAADILVDGREFHTIVIDGRAGRPGAVEYTISGGGRLEAVDGRVGGIGVNIERDDVVRGTVARGTVGQGLDGFRVYGALPQVRLSDPSRAAVIIDQVRVDTPPPVGPGPRPPRERYVTVEFDRDRYGGDFADFRLDQANPNRCAEACNRNEDCVAYTYVPPRVHGPSPHCWLKDRVTDARVTEGMVAGVKRSPLPQLANVDYWGGDYRDFRVDSRDPTVCAEACADERRCRAYTFVPPGRWGAEGRCWLKDTLPAASRVEGLVSGSK